MFKETQNAPFGSAAASRRVAMALFVTFELAGGANNKIWVNAELITSVRPAEGCTMIHFDKDHSLAVSDPMDRVMLQITTNSIAS